jgi:transposase-like protein
MEIAQTGCESLEALGAELGLLVMDRLMEAERERLCGPRYAHRPDRKAFRNGRQPGQVVFAGRWVPMLRPRVIDRQEREIPLSTYARFQADGAMQQAVAGKILHGVSTRAYEKVIDSVMDGYGIKRSSVSRHFREATREELRQLLERPLGDLRLCALLIDGVGFADVLLIVALGVDESGKKHILGLWQGSTENATVCKALLDDLVRRGFDPEKRYLVVLDGSKALRKAVDQVLGENAVVQRCQVHKRRNVKEHLPEEHQAEIDRRIRTAHAMLGYREAKHSLLTTVQYVERLNPSAARSLQEGLEETLTLHKLGMPEALRTSFASTNLIESAFSRVRDVTRNVKRWRDGDHAQRWAAAALLFAEKRFRRVKGCRQMGDLVHKLRPELDVLQEAA